MSRRPHAVVMQMKLWNFACTIAEGKSVDAALEAAGWSRNTKGLADVDAEGNSIRVRPIEHSMVKAYLAEIQREVRSTSVNTVHTLIAELEEARGVAQEKEHASAMVQATMGKAKLLGIGQDHKAPPVKPVEAMNEQELRIVAGLEDAHAAVN